jgi:Dolichyl-phosphate-mannose-protein mannosyltransferase
LLLRSPRAHALAIFSGHALLFVALAWWSWRKWPDPLIDFGRELYTPWQITRGRVLYRDIDTLFGPLSPYLNALWFRVFGVSMMTLAICNMAIFALIVAGIHRLLRRSTDRGTATAASIVALVLFGFCQYIEAGNYNFVCPYSHEATHGLALAVGMALCVQQALGGERPNFFWTLAGVLFGATLLTKPELSLAAAAGVVVAWACSAVVERSDLRRLTGIAALFVSGAALVPLAFFLYFRLHMEASDALRAIGSALINPAVSGIAANTFYQTGMGLEAPFANLLRMLAAFGALIAFVGAAVALSASPARSTSRSVALHRGLRLCLIVVGIYFIPWYSVPRALPLIAITALVALILQLRQVRHDRARTGSLISLIAWSTFGLVLLAKMALNARLTQYGFYLALPATTVAIVLVGWVIPSAIHQRAGEASARSFRAVTVWALAGAIASYLGVSHGMYRAKDLAIGGNGDRFYVSSAPGRWRGTALADTLREVERVAAPSSTLAVLPEGVMINYLTRRDSPLRVINLMPPELETFGEDSVLRSLAAAPPDLIVLVHKDMREYGYPMFGEDPRYGRRVLDWINARYRRIAVAGRNPMQASGFGIEVFEASPR